MLGTGSIIRQGRNVPTTGDAGCGESFLTCTPGRYACRMGIRLLFPIKNRFIKKIAPAKLDGNCVKPRNQI